MLQIQLSLLFVNVRSVTLMIRMGCLVLFVMATVCEISKCEPILKPSFVIDVSDSLTAAPVTLGLKGTVQAGALVDTFLVHGNQLFYTQTYRPGTYQIRIDATNYRTWSRDGVRLRMTADGCHIETVELSARMVPLQ